MKNSYNNYAIRKNTWKIENKEEYSQKIAPPTILPISFIGFAPNAGSLHF